MHVKSGPPKLVVPEVTCEEATPTYGKFVAQPVEPGYGVTLGNALRRVLLSSLPGAAVTWVRIEGVLHEFSTIPHMKEDVMEFLLNVKSLHLRPVTGNPGRLFLDVRGEGEVTAADIHPSPDFEIVNPELVLATLDSPEARLFVEFNVELGRGYLPVEGQRKDRLPLNALAVDAIFNPVVRVNFITEPLRIQETEYEKLVLEVWTNGAMTPQEAVAQSAQILVQQLARFAGDISSLTMLFVPPSVSPDTPVDKLSFPARVKNALRRGGINTLGELLEKTETELLDLPAFGDKALEELKQALKQMGLSLRQEGER